MRVVSYKETLLNTDGYVKNMTHEILIECHLSTEWIQLPM